MASNGGTRARFSDRIVNLVPGEVRIGLERDVLNKIQQRREYYKEILTRPFRTMSWQAWAFIGAIVCFLLALYMRYSMVRKQREEVIKHFIRRRRPVEQSRSSLGYGELQ